jgi:hypothetical protein
MQYATRNAQQLLMLRIACCVLHVACCVLHIVVSQCEDKKGDRRGEYEKWYTCVRLP